MNIDCLELLNSEAQLLYNILDAAKRLLWPRFEIS